MPVSPYGLLVSQLGQLPLRPATRAEWSRWMDRGPATWIHDDAGRAVQLTAAPNVDPAGPDQAIPGQLLWALWMAPEGFVVARNDRGRLRLTKESLMVEGETVALTAFQGRVLYQATEPLWTEAAARWSQELENESRSGI